MNTDLELYRIFCIVVEHKNISKAAKSMYISQSAITQSIQKLEGNLGGKVFYRSRNGVELTEEGRSLYEYVKDSIDTINNAKNVFSNYANLEKDKIRIGGESNLLISSVFEPILKFIKKYPKINISIKKENIDIMIQELTNNELDIVVFSLPYNNKKYSNIEIMSLKKSIYCSFANKEYLRDITDRIEIIKEAETAEVGIAVLNTNMSKATKELIREIKNYYK